MIELPLPGGRQPTPEEKRMIQITAAMQVVEIDRGCSCTIAVGRDPHARLWQALTVEYEVIYRRYIRT